MYPVYGLKTFQTLANHFHLLSFKVAGVIPSIFTQTKVDEEEQHKD